MLLAIGISAVLGDLFVAARPARAESLQFWYDYRPDGSYAVYCLIYQPNVRQPRTEYPSCWFFQQERVTLFAWGCANRGGNHPSWVRYVDPQGPQTQQYGRFYGLTNLGATGGNLHRIWDVWGRRLPVDRNITPYLVLGYVDQGYPNYSDAYTDNGYYDRDNGWGNQCVGQPDATVWVVIENPLRPVAAPKGTGQPGKGSEKAPTLEALKKRSPVAAATWYKGKPLSAWLRDLADQKSEVRGEAITALATIAAEHRKTLPLLHTVAGNHLTAALHDSHPAIRARASEALKKLGVQTK